MAEQRHGRRAITSIRPWGAQPHLSSSKTVSGAAPPGKRQGPNGAEQRRASERTSERASGLESKTDPAGESERHQLGLFLATKLSRRRRSAPQQLSRSRSRHIEYVSLAVLPPPPPPTPPPHLTAHPPALAFAPATAHHEPMSAADSGPSSAHCAVAESPPKRAGVPRGEACTQFMRQDGAGALGWNPKAAKRMRRQTCKSRGNEARPIAAARAPGGNWIYRHAKGSWRYTSHSPLSPRRYVLSRYQAQSSGRSLVSQFTKHEYCKVGAI